MNEQLIEKITKMVVEKLQTSNLKTDDRDNDNKQMPVMLFQETLVGNRFTEETVRATPDGNVKFFDTALEDKKPKSVNLTSK